jgi:hypothetical protein
MIYRAELQQNLVQDFVACIQQSAIRTINMAARNPELEGVPFSVMIDKIFKQFPGKEAYVRSETKKRAELHASLNATYDELCWFLAEADLSLRNLYALKIEKKFSSASAISFTEGNIKMLAEEISQYHNSLPDLEWLLAERKVLADLLGND